MTTSAYNLGNKGLASKILRTEDLTRAALAEASSVSEIETDFFSLCAVGADLGCAVLGAVPSSLVGRLCIVPTWHV
jgi:hypothetical protein